jgi:hypothetical protein
MATRDTRLTEKVVTTASVLAVAAAAFAAVLAAGPASASQTQPQVRHVPPTNVTTGGPLRPGVYGRIEVGPATTVPPLIYPQPVRVRQQGAADGAKPVYLYVPPGQVRKWARHCDQWKACSAPVYFVRMDDSPSKLGKWKETRPMASVSIVQAFAPRAN